MVKALSPWILTIVAGLGLANTSGAQLSLNAVDTAYSINFDTTVTGVNNGQFAAPSFVSTANPDPGQLNSNAFAFRPTSATGNGTFGGSQSGGQGISNGGITDGGVYAFNIPGNGRALGFQPTGSVYDPGAVFLRAVNNTGGSVNSFTFSVDAFARNDQSRNQIISFSYSTNNTTYVS